jgi:hypothetical protein
MSRRGARRSRAERVLLLLLALLAVSPSARADDDAEARARDAYDRGSFAYKAGDFERAATEFTAADRLAPSPVTLRAALDAAMLADDAVLGAELLDRAGRVLPEAQVRGPTASEAELATVASTARARFAHRTGRIVVRCSGAAPCLATVDGVPVEPSRARIVAVGVHTVTLQAAGRAEPRLVDVPSDQVVEVAAAAPALAVSLRPAPDPGGLSPAWFIAAGITTGVALGLSIGSGVDTLNQHANFDDAGCVAKDGASCSSLKSSGIAAQTRTNVLLVATGALAVTTVTLGLFATRWHAPATASVGLDLHGGRVLLGATF